MEKKLNVFDRLLLMQTLPVQGNYATIRLINELAGKLGLSADEHSEFEIINEEETGRVTWNEKGNEERPLQFKDKELEMIKNSLLKLDKEGKLDVRHTSLCEKFLDEVE